MNGYTEGRWKIGNDPGPDGDGFASGPIEIISEDELTIICSVSDGLPYYETRSNAERIVALHNVVTE